MPPNNHVVILIHGIRDYALWQERIRPILSERFIVKSINYGRFDLFRFLFPFSYFRDQAIEAVWDQIRDIRKEHQKAKLSFIAHSFGTYILANILLREFDFKAFRVVFCGSVVKYDFPFQQISERFCGPILNEVGAKDNWPALAESATWGYGSAGTYGFRTPRVRDRWHAGARHGYFLESSFCTTFWVPFFQDGTIVNGTSNPEDPPFWLKALSIFRLKYLVLLILLAVIAIFAFMPEAREVLGRIVRAPICYPYDPYKDSPDNTQDRRSCLFGRLSYVKWVDESDYPDVDRPTGRWPNDRANRILTISSVEEDGTVVWAERNLLRVDGDRYYWQKPSLGIWTEIIADSSAIIPGQTGALLRRQDPDQTCESSGKRKLLEAFLPINLDETLEDANREIKMCYRWAEFDCSNKRPLQLVPNNTHFSICVGRFVFAIKD